MKRVILGSLLSCMLVGQMFGAENGPLVNLDAATSSSREVSDLGMRRALSCNDLGKLSPQSNDEFLRTLKSPSSPVEATAVGQTVGADQQVRPDWLEFKKALIHGTKANFAGIGLGLAWTICMRGSNPCDLTKPVNLAGFAYNAVRPLVSKDSEDFKWGQFMSIPASVVTLPLAWLTSVFVGAACYGVYNICPSFSFGRSSGITIDLNAIRRYKNAWRSI
jgi:hypothetical protein